MSPLKRAEPLTPRGLERRLKRHVLKAEHSFLAVGAPGFEGVLAQEVATLPGVAHVAALRGGVTFEGPLSTLYHANLRLRSAHRVLWRVAEFLAQSQAMLYNQARRVPWAHYVGFGRTLRFVVSARSSRLNHHEGVSETLLSAIQDALEPLGLRPERAEDAALELHVRFFRDRCTLSLNTSGTHLHKRGYRTHVGDAPLRETLAAAILQTVRFDAFDLIVDPMCGSGTLLLEAAQMRARIPAGHTRAFAFEHFPSFNPSLWQRLKREALAERQEISAALLGFDLSPDMVRATQANAERAGVARATHVAVADARTLTFATLASNCKKPLLIVNPPYGKRLAAGYARALCQDLCRAVSASPGWTVALLTPDPSWLVNLKTLEQHAFKNGNLRLNLVVAQS